MSDNLPDNGGYVAAAYLVFPALVLIYVAIMAIRLSRLERDLAQLNEAADRPAPDEVAEPREEVRAT
ncbi:MAG: hypothetical protein HZB46_17660 [Solirubrobacterales bacterium]|nr:hypothetical protein [Solirubrobacterales bacterium]